MPNLTQQEIDHHNLVRVQGQMVERDALNIAEKITLFDSNLYVQYLENPDSVNDPPFRVMEHCRDGIDRVVLTAWVLDDRVFQRIVAADTQHFDILNALDKKNTAARANDRRRYQEKQEELNRLAFDVLRSSKDTYTANHPETGEKLKFTS